MESAHPRVCGENREDPAPGGRPAGSSPRVRGKREAICHIRLSAGLIPACAGKTDSTPTPSCTTTAHPRVCGENSRAASIGATLSGSSPRVRGKQGGLDAGGRARGLIPACAGKTRLMGFQGLRRRAHPRVCGENLLERRGQLPRQGSSPRVRGKHRSGHQRHLGGGLIPACAGKTASHRASPGRRPAHPRVCGENESIGKLLFQGDGSSPRVRGKRDHGLLRRGPPGLIPACAGKTLRRRASAS